MADKNDGWGSEWPDAPKEWSGKEIAKAQADQGTVSWPISSTDWIAEACHDHTPWLTGLDLGIGEKTVLTTFENDGLKHRIISQTELKSQGSNLVDNQQYLYFQCESCNEILDPHTKSFAKLQEHRVNAGWKCVWNTDGMGYKVYCAKCGEKVA